MYFSHIILSTFNKNVFQLTFPYPVSLSHVGLLFMVMLVLGSLILINILVLEKYKKKLKSFMSYD